MEALIQLKPPPQQVSRSRSRSCPGLQGARRHADGCPSPWLHSRLTWLGGEGYREAMDKPSSPEVPPGGPYPGEQQTRLSGAWTALVVGVVALLVILVFILQNLQSVELYFLTFHGHLPLAIALLFAVILGAVIVLAFGGGRILQLRLVARRARHSSADASPPDPMSGRQP